MSSQFKQMLLDAADALGDDDSHIHNVTVIISAFPNEEGQVEQQVLTNVAVPLQIIAEQLTHAFRAITKAKQQLMPAGDSEAVN
jgi:hypothetical protein